MNWRIIVTLVNRCDKIWERRELSWFKQIKVRKPDEEQSREITLRIKRFITSQSLELDPGEREEKDFREGPSHQES